MFLELLMVTAVMPNIGSSDPQTRNAVNHATAAYYKQSGLSDYVKKLERENFSPEVRKATGTIVWIKQVVDTQTVTYGWEF